MAMTQKDFEKHIESYVQIDTKLRSIADEYANKFEGGGYVTGIEVDYDGFFGTVEVTGYIPSHCSCCSDDYMSFYFPLRYLCEDDWAEQVQAERDKEERKREEAKRMKEEEQKKKDTEAERRLFETLKEKYQPTEIERLKLENE